MLRSKHMHIQRVIAVTVSFLLLSAACLAQTPPAKKSYTFHGKVEAVNEKEKFVTVNGEEVKGWMSAMTMDYQVDDPAVLKKLKAGDQISATVYDNDPVLHKVQVVPKKDDKSKK